MQKGIKFRLYPNKIQRDLINRTFGCVRLVYNLGLDMRNTAFQNHEKCGYMQTSAMLTALKKEKPFLAEVDSIALQQSLRDLDRAFQNFFAHRAKHPGFHGKHNNHPSYRTVNQGNSIRLLGKYIRLPKLGYVKIRQSMDLSNTRIRNVTVERTPTGKYFAVLCVECGCPAAFSHSREAVGIDVGLREFYTDSSGRTISNPRYLERREKKLCREQRRLSRKVKGSSNRRKQRIRVARIHEQISDMRNDFLQKVSTALVKENQIICVEDLNVEGMLRNHKLAKHIQSVSWSRFFQMLRYKADWYGSIVVAVPTFYPSSQICCQCGYKNPLTKDLRKEWDCPVCGAHHDRDRNAALNILRKGLCMLQAAS